MIFKPDVGKVADVGIAAESSSVSAKRSSKEHMRVGSIDEVGAIDVVVALGAADFPFPFEAAFVIVLFFLGFSSSPVKG